MSADIAVSSRQPFSDAAGASSSASPQQTKIGSPSGRRPAGLAISLDQLEIRANRGEHELHQLWIVQRFDRRAGEGPQLLEKLGVGHHMPDARQAPGGRRRAAQNEQLRRRRAASSCARSKASRAPMLCPNTMTGRSSSRGVTASAIEWTIAARSSSGLSIILAPRPGGEPGRAADVGNRCRR